jgi:UDP-N-acetylmuramoylalanine--D-glutamate ligase
VIVVDPRLHEAERVASLLGAEVPDDLTEAVRHCTVLVADEWTPELAPHVATARAVGAQVTCLAELVLRRAAVPVVGVTGTAGKTTACHRLAALLDAAGRPYAMARTARAANAWPDADLYEVAPRLRPPAVIIAELTSTHLVWMATSPQVAVVTCLWPDHAELHGSVGAYVAAKRRIVEFQRPDDVALLGPGVPFTGPGRTVRFTGDPADAAAAELGVPVAEVPDPVLPHRFRDVPGPPGIRVVDDSMAATPRKAVRGVERLAGELGGIARVVLLAGGEDPGVHRALEEELALREACAAVRGARVIAFGAAAPRLLAELPDARRADDLEAAMAAAAELARPGDAILLAPMFPLPMAARERFSSRWTSVSGSSSGSPAA